MGCVQRMADSNIERLNDCWRALGLNAISASIHPDILNALRDLLSEVEPEKAKALAS
jgi:hypothetical protein